MKIRVALIAVLFAAVGLRLSPVHADQGGIPAQVAALQQAVQTLQQQDGAQNTAIARLKGVVNAQTVVITQLQHRFKHCRSRLVMRSLRAWSWKVSPPRAAIPPQR